MYGIIIYRNSKIQMIFWYNLIRQNARRHMIKYETTYEKNTQPLFFPPDRSNGTRGFSDVAAHIHRHVEVQYIYENSALTALTPSTVTVCCSFFRTVFIPQEPTATAGIYPSISSSTRFRSTSGYFRTIYRSRRSFRPDSSRPPSTP